MKILSYFNFFIVIFLFSFLRNINSQPNSNPALILPHTIGGWEASTERTFNDSTLYDYIDGNAELFLSFGFTKVYNRIYSRANQPDILVDIFYMNSSYDAFGVFSFSVGKTGNDFGVNSQIANGAIVFWKDKYYVSIACYPETEESKIAIREIAKLIDDSILPKGELPGILNCLPSTSLNDESIRYFRHYIWLNSHIFISNENILNIDQTTEAVIAKYGENDKSILLIIKYPDSTNTLIAKEKFIKNYNPGLLNSPIIKNQAGKWCGIESTINFFIGIFNGIDKESTINLINQTKEKINGSTTSK